MEENARAEKLTHEEIKEDAEGLILILECLPSRSSWWLQYVVITHLLRSLDQSTAQLRIHDHLVGVIGSGPFRRSRPALRVSCNVVFCIGTPMPSSPRIGHTRRSPSPCASVTSGVATDTLPSPSLCPANDNASIVVSLACSSIELSVIATSNPPTAAVGHLCPASRHVLLAQPTYTPPFSRASARAGSTVVRGLVCLRHVLGVLVLGLFVLSHRYTAWPLRSCRHCSFRLQSPSCRTRQWSRGLCHLVGCARLLQLSLAVVPTAVSIVGTGAFCTSATLVFISTACLSGPTRQYRLVALSSAINRLALRLPVHPK
ncbi:hypothetical protein GN244_ATG15774 [Phytophthora infestans]|uniref:Transmembrane protein n=1 Tax=Phytophthora infestans TaxID=4787 RepID=A0A833SUR4_PHYIN|nr:hypothetical protein GN244_ATG15774 [Phytophthora infestans]KAF4143333.1 hypothetical protein GN958_ATG07475 [Phytophthora infestans]KAF4143742.1 hypothetical protein GN958_ATG07067 [Phytophthora infestans]